MLNHIYNSHYYSLNYREIRTHYNYNQSLSQPQPQSVAVPVAGTTTVITSVLLQLPGGRLELPKLAKNLRWL